jgi:hypothetical protein
MTHPARPRATPAVLDGERARRHAATPGKTTKTIKTT